MQKPSPQTGKAIRKRALKTHLSFLRFILRHAARWRFAAQSCSIGKRN
jgi:hypothetical protein